MNEITVYIVEDDKLTRKTYIQYFSNTEGIKILDTFDTAEECLNMMSKKPADIVLMDLGLPSMNGIEATRNIQNLYESTKVIVLTSHERTDEVFASLACGAKAYAMKDIPLEDLTGVIKEVHKGNVWLDKRIANLAMEIYPKPERTDSFENLYISTNAINSLTEKELTILGFIADKNMSNHQIAKQMNLSPHTIKSHVSNILSKLSVSNRVKAKFIILKYRMLQNN